LKRARERRHCTVPARPKSAEADEGGSTIPPRRQ
jgi:hypothetical protein